jgi:putative transposase
MRTIKRESVILNKAKLCTVRLIASSYAKEKQHWLSVFQQHSFMGLIKKHRLVRNQFVKDKYDSPYGLQARMWKLALIDAAETMDKYWESIFEKIRKLIYNNSGLDNEQRHYCYWLLKDYERLVAVLLEQPIEFKTLSLVQRRWAIKWLKKTIKHHRKNYPVSKLNRSFALDGDCYSLFEHHGIQYIKIMTLIKGKRMAIPLKGSTPIKGNIRLVLNGANVQVHYTATIKAKKRAANEDVIGIDFGYTEVLTDSDANQYGKDFGRNMTAHSDWLKKKMQNRHKLHALQKKYSLSSDNKKQKKAKLLLKNNLGHKKLNRTVERHQSSSLTLINTAFNEMMKKASAKTIVSEDLSHLFTYKNNKTWNRRLSSWLRGALKERLTFKALVKGFDHQQVNAAYTSQTCPDCDFVDASNRCSHNKDKFRCQHCKTEGHSDVFAAINLRARYFDREITRYTPYREVKAILLERFHRRLESEQSQTVSGRILETHKSLSTGLGQSESEYQKKVNCYV